MRRTGEHLVLSTEGECLEKISTKGGLSELLFDVQQCPSQRKAIPIGQIAGNRENTQSLAFLSRLCISGIIVRLVNANCAPHCTTDALPRCMSWGPDGEGVNGVHLGKEVR